MTISPGDRLAVTGGTGALGRQVVTDVLQAGYRVRLLSRRPLQTIDAGVDCEFFDLFDDEPLPPQKLDGCAAVIHLAAHIPPDQNNPSAAGAAFKANTLGTIRLLQAMEHAGIPRLFQTTAANAYSSNCMASDETAPMYPSQHAPFYLTSKLAQDIFGTHWAKRRGLRTTTLRVSSLYGAGQDKGLFTRFATALLRKECVHLINGGSYAADFVTISDVSSALLLFIGEDLDGPFNVASGQRATLLAAARHLIPLTGCTEERLIVDPVTVGEASFPRIDISRARSCGFMPTNLRDGLADLVDWIKSGSSPAAT